MIAELARRMARSLEVVSVSLVSFVPVNAARVLACRAWGATIGRGTAIHHGLQARACRRISIGEDCFLAENLVLDGRGGLTVGAHVSINSGVQIWTAQHDWTDSDFAYSSAPVEIGNRVWICSRSVVLPGSRIGEGAVIAAGAVVSGDVAPWTVVGGVPARVIAKRPRVDRYVLNATANKIWWW